MFLNSLLAKSLKAKYYPYLSFEQAGLGNYPSYTWRNIWEARKVLENGLMWRVGDGADISIWHDAWVPGLVRNRVHNSELNTIVVKVVDLLNPISR